MPAGFLHRFDSGEGIWRRDYHRSDIYYKGVRTNLGTTLIFNNTFATDFLLSSAWLTAISTAAVIQSAQLMLTTSLDVHIHDILALFCTAGLHDSIAVSFPMPLEIKSGYKILVSAGANGHVWGGICGTQENPA